MRYLIQLAVVAVLATGLALAQSSPSSSQPQQPSSSGSQSQTSPSSSGSQTSPSSTQPDQTQTQPSTTQPSTPDKDKDKDATGQQSSKMPQGESSAASATDVESTIQQAIQKDPSLSGANIQVKATEKEVDLSGTVNSNDEKKTAEQIAKTNAGHRKVKNHIKVKSASTTAPPATTTPK
jgi:opacity protein-like surface antigen